MKVVLYWLAPVATSNVGDKQFDRPDSALFQQGGASPLFRFCTVAANRACCALARKCRGPGPGCPDAGVHLSFAVKWSIKGHQHEPEPEDSMAATDVKATYTPAENRYAGMPYRRCGRSGLKLPAISLGLWQSLGEPGMEDVCRKACYFAFDNGITHFDLANNYGPPPGNSEIVFGEILKSMPRDELIISTKAGYYMWPGPYGEWGSKKYLVASLDQSLRRMKLDYVDIFYHHRPDPDTPLEESMGALDLIVKQGKALYAGVSSYNGRQFADAVRVIRDHDWTPLTIHQPKINLLERNFEFDLLPHAAAWGCGVIAFCPLAQGRLSDKYLNGIPRDSRMAKRDDAQKWYDQQKAAGIWDKVAKLNDIAKARGQTLPQMALAWLLRDERITSVLIGASKVEQIAENLGALKNTAFTDEELKKIDQITRC